MSMGAFADLPCILGKGPSHSIILFIPEFLRTAVKCAHIRKHMQFWSLLLVERV